ncbi:MAG: recombinase family protein [Firmicutes bacterium]|nr:recombinase family protein [Bacillota bacterium]
MTKRVALYCRVSTEEQALHGFSLDAQKDALKSYAKDHNMYIAGIYIDEGISGKLPAAKRPAMMRMLDELSENNIDQILFIKLDRWFRSVKEYYKVQEILDRNKVTWRAILEDYNTETSDGILKVNIMLSVAQNEAERTGERIKFVLDNKAQKKQVVGKQPYGYKIVEIDGYKRSVIDEETAPIVRDIFDTFERTGSSSLTLKHINKTYGTTFSYVFLKRLLRRSAYAGAYLDIKDYRPAYISYEQYEKNMQVLDGSHIKRTPTGRIYIFSGLIFCKHCGHRFKGKCTKSKYYCCSRAMDDYSCVNRKHISELKIEKYLTENIIKLMHQYIYDVEVQYNENKNLRSSEKEIASLKNKLNRLNEIYLDGNMDRDNYVRKTEQIKTELKEAEKLNLLLKPKDISHIKTLLHNNFLHNYDMLSDEDKRTLWRSVIKRIEIDDTLNMTIIFA